MTTVVLSPHTDDAIFSLGAHLDTLDDVVIASVFAGIPTDYLGRRKHEKLREEHTRACAKIGASEVNAEFLDDVYQPSPPDAVEAWIWTHVHDADTVYIPVGIHHPDHLRVTEIAAGMLDDMRRVFFYEELPYRVDYPELATQRVIDVAVNGPLYGWQAESSPAKRAAVDCYASQIDSSVIGRVMVRENIWELQR